jgi:two-component system phosphate regulon response regulator PhoB
LGSTASARIAAPREPRTGESIARVLVVDDDDAVRLLVRRALEREGLHVDEAPDAARALQQFERTQWDLIVLDVNLPDRSGLEVLEELRALGDMPVIMLSGRTDEADRVAGLETGADDYVVKPFYPRELAARVRSLLRRSGVHTRPSLLEFDDLAIDTAGRQAFLGGKPIELTAREFDLLEFLASAPRQAFSRSQLLQRVWGSSTAWQQESTVTEHVRRIRRKLGVEADQSRWIATVRGFGYRFEP